MARSTKTEGVSHEETKSLLTSRLIKTTKAKIGISFLPTGASGENISAGKVLKEAGIDILY